MRLPIMLALSLTAAAAVGAHAQIQPPRNPYAVVPPTIGSMKSTQPIGGATFKPYQAPKPSADPFSPAGQAARERRGAAAERARTNGVFSPAGEAKRERAQARRDAANNPF